MSLSGGHLDALLAAGASAEQIVALVKADLAERDTLAERRRERDRDRQRRHRSRDVTVTRCDPPNDNILTPGVTPTSNDVGPKPKSRGTRLPNDWTLPDEWRQWAKERRGWSDKNISEEAEIFANYWQAKSGAGALHTDWFKTWRNWVLRSHRPDEKGASKTLSAAEQIENLRKAIELYDRMGKRDEAQEARRKIAMLEAA